MDEKYNKAYIEIYNKEPVLKSRLATGTNNTTLNYLIKNGFICNVKRINNIPNLFKFNLIKNNKSVYSFVFDIVPSCVSDLEDKRVQVKTITNELLEFLKQTDEKINVIAGYCEFGDTIFCYNNEKSFIFNKSKDNTSVHIKLHWLYKSILENKDFILSNNNENEKFSNLLITNNPNTIINCLNGNFNFKYNLLKNFDKNNYEITKYKQMILDKVNLLNYEEVGNLTTNKFDDSHNYNDCDLQNKKYSINDLKLFSSLISSENDNLFLINENSLNEINDVKKDILDDIVFSTSDIQYQEITEKIYTHTVIDSLKIEGAFNILLSNNELIKEKIFKNINDKYRYHVWVNKNEESYLPYDFVINADIYIDVKSTWKDEKLSFHISDNENLFRQQIKQKNGHYFIVLIYDIKLIHNSINNELKYKIKIISNNELDKMQPKINYEYNLLGENNE